MITSNQNAPALDQRNSLILYINGSRHEISGDDAFLSLSEYLRLRQRLVGTKIVCEEGDCGACSVLVGKSKSDRFEYRAINSCIVFMYQLDRTHIVTVEGLGRIRELNAVQQTMVDCHGSQCGFCTPGFVVALSGMLEDGRRLEDNELRLGLSGNLCRCTGYQSILDAGHSIDPAAMKTLGELYPSAAMLSEFADLGGQTVRIDSSSHGEAALPTNWDEAVRYRAENPFAVVIAGGTDLGVQINKRIRRPDRFLCLANVANAVGVEVDPSSRSVRIGAATTWTEIERFAQDNLPELYEIVVRFGSPQIRNIGTLAGNLANASPVADSLPFLMVLDAEIDLLGPTGVRRMPLADFYLGYKKLALAPNELIRSITFERPRPGSKLRLYKVSKRRDLDISTFSAAILMELDGAAIVAARVAMGGVGPTVPRLRDTETFLVGKEFTRSTFLAAGAMAAGEIRPIGDVRGSSDYRLRLARNVFLKFFEEINAGSKEAVA